MILFLLGVCVEIAVLTIGAVSRSALACLFDHLFIPFVNSCGRLISDYQRHETAGWFALRSCYAKKTPWKRVKLLFDRGIREGWLLNNMTFAWNWAYLYLANMRFGETREVVDWLCDKVPLDAKRLQANRSTEPNVLESLKRPFFAKALLNWSAAQDDRSLSVFVLDRKLNAVPLYPKYLHFDESFAFKLGMGDSDIAAATLEATLNLEAALKQHRQNYH